MRFEKKTVLCKPVAKGLTEQEKAEAGYLYNPNSTNELAAYRAQVQDAMCEYNTMKVSDVKGRRDFLAQVLGKVGKVCNILPPFKCDYGFHIEIG